MSTIESPDNSSTYKVIGAICLAIAIASFFFSLLPCIGSLALVTSVLALIGSGISYSKLDPAKKERGVSLAAVIISIVALLFSGGQAIFLGSAASEFEGMESISEELRKEMERAAEEAAANGEENPFELFPELLNDSTLKALDSIMESQFDTTDVN